MALISLGFRLLRLIVVVKFVLRTFSVVDIMETEKSPSSITEKTPTIANSKKTANAILDCAASWCALSMVVFGDLPALEKVFSWFPGFHHIKTVMLLVVAFPDLGISRILVLDIASPLIKYAEDEFGLPKTTVTLEEFVLYLPLCIVLLAFPALGQESSNASESVEAITSAELTEEIAETRNKLSLLSKIVLDFESSLPPSESGENLAVPTNAVDTTNSEAIDHTKTEKSSIPDEEGDVISELPSNIQIRRKSTNIKNRRKSLMFVQTLFNSDISSSTPSDTDLQNGSSSSHIDIDSQRIEEDGYEVITAADFIDSNLPHSSPTKTTNSISSSPSLVQSPSDNQPVSKSVKKSFIKRLFRVNSKSKQSSQSNFDQNSTDNNSPDRGSMTMDSHIYHEDLSSMTSKVSLLDDVEDSIESQDNTEHSSISLHSNDDDDDNQTIKVSRTQSFLDTMKERTSISRFAETSKSSRRMSSIYDFDNESNVLKGNANSNTSTSKDKSKRFSFFGR